MRGRFKRYSLAWVTGSIFVVRGDRETWRLFAHGTAAAVVALAAIWAARRVWLGGSQFWSSLELPVLTLVLANVFGFYRLIVITVLCRFATRCSSPRTAASKRST